MLVFSVLTAAGQDLDWNIKNSLVSKYLGTIGVVISDDPSFVNDITVSKGNYYAGIWTATGIGHGPYGRTFKDELDPYIGLSHSFGPLKYEITAIYFAIANLGKMNDDLWVIDQQLSSSGFHGFKPYVVLRCFNRVGSQSPEGGWYLWAGVRREQSVGRYKLNIDMLTSYSDGPLGKNPGQVYYKTVLNSPIPISKSVILTPTISYQVPTSQQRKSEFPFARKSEFVFGVTLSYHLHPDRKNGHK